MVIVEYDPRLKKRIKKIKDGLLKLKIKKQIAKILKYPETGKPMRFSRKGTGEVYISPFRLSYIYFKNKNKLVFLDFYHKNKQ